MEEQDQNQGQTQSLKRPPRAQADTTLLQTFTELLDLRYLAFDAVLHPIEGLNAYAPYANLKMFGSKNFGVTDIPNLDGKVILVTGGNAGLGYEAIKALAAHSPAHIFMASRTESKATVSIEAIHKINPGANITFLPLDLSSFASILAAANTFKAQSQRLDILMLNAGVMALPPGTTQEGFEIQLGTNHLGHFLLVKLLTPTLQSTAKLPNADVRVVTLTSEAHNMARTKSALTSQKELEAGGAWARYAYSKLANVLFAKELARRHPEILSVSVHPGLVNTPLWDTTQASNIFVRAGLAVAGWLRVTPEQGALSQVWAATAKQQEVENGAYYKPIGSKSAGSPLAADGRLAEEFWVWSEKEVEGKGY